MAEILTIQQIFRPLFQRLQLVLLRGEWTKRYQMGGHMPIVDAF